MNIVIHSREHLIFRDGRPFGDVGHVNGGVLSWPWPSTVTGMLRTRIGLSRDENMFQTRDNSPELVYEHKVKELKAIHAKRIVPLWQENGPDSDWQYLFPAPADALVQPVANSSALMYTISGFTYEDPFDQGGVNLPWVNWRIPVTDAKKPARDTPALWYREHFFTWLKTGRIDRSLAAADLGLPYPQPVTRMHTAIDTNTGVAETGRLFSSDTICLLTAKDERHKAGRLGIGVELNHTKVQDNPFGPCFFGAERKTALVEELKVPFPTCKSWFANKKFLRLVLISPGEFGAWAPQWLLPAKKSKETDWSMVPGSEIVIRLCSAIVPPWQAVSGWDYAQRGPKATRKFVPAGAVYVVELKDPGKSQELAELLWGRSIADNLENPDGCGVVCVGNIDL